MSGLYFWGGCALHSPFVISSVRYAKRRTAWKTQISVKEWFFSKKKSLVKSLIFRWNSLNWLSLCKMSDCFFHEFCVTFYVYMFWMYVLSSKHDKEISWFHRFLFYDLYIGFLKHFLFKKTSLYSLTYCYNAVHSIVHYLYIFVFTFLASILFVFWIQHMILASVIDWILIQCFFLFSSKFLIKL